MLLIRLAAALWFTRKGHWCKSSVAAKNVSASSATWKGPMCWFRSYGCIYVCMYTFRYLFLPWCYTMTPFLPINSIVYVGAKLIWDILYRRKHLERTGNSFSEDLCLSTGDSIYFIPCESECACPRNSQEWPLPEGFLMHLTWVHTEKDSSQGQVCISSCPPAPAPRTNGI